MLQLLLLIFYITITLSRNIQFGFVFGGGEWSSIYAKYDSSIALKSLESLAKTGATHVRILHQWFQDNINSTTVYPITNPNSSLISPTDKQLSTIINASHALGLKTVLAPVLDNSWDLPQYQSRNGWCFSTKQQTIIPCQSKQHWRGQIGTYFNSSDWNNWFQSYTKYILKYAQMAQQHNCFMYEAAAELYLTFTQEQLWRDLIIKIRKVYNGKLTVAGYDIIKFWDVLDYIGLEGYRSLYGSSINELKQSWQLTVQSWNNLSKTWNKSILITEVGYQSRPSGYSQGANNPRYDALDCSIMEYICTNQSLQSMAYQALFETFIDIDWFEGVYFWLWRTDSWQGGDSDNEFTPHGKDAERVFYEFATGNNKNNFNFTWNLDSKYPENIIFNKDKNVINVVNNRINGFNFGSGIWSSFKYQYGSNGAYKSLINMKNETGSNTVKFIASWRFNNYSSPNFYFDKWTPTIEELEIIFQQAINLGFKRIIFAPYIDQSFDLQLQCVYTDSNYSYPNCWKNKHWRGFWGELFNENDWNIFFENYNKMILSYIPLLNKYNISDYLIATELMTMIKTHSTQFINIINNVKNNGYKGKISIDFIFENNNVNISLYKALDYIGISGYYPLNINVSNNNMPWQNPTLQQVINSWQPIILQLDNISKLSGNKMIVFTEIGYQSRSWPWIQPSGIQQLDGSDCSVWDQCYNMAHQAYCYEGLFRSIYLQEWFGGVVWWLWRSDPYHGGPVDDSFTPRGKPAAEILKKYWT